MSVSVTLRDPLSTKLVWHLTLGCTQDTPGVLTLGAQVEAAKFLRPCLETSQRCFLHVPAVQRASHKTRPGLGSRTRQAVSIGEGQLEGAASKELSRLD